MNALPVTAKTWHIIISKLKFRKWRSLHMIDFSRAVLYGMFCQEKPYCNNRFLDCCADVDVSSLSEQECDIFTKPVTDPAGRRDSAPDVRKDRQTALAKELLKPKYQVYGFKTADLHKNLSGHFQNLAQIRYEMSKLKARGVLIKSNNKSFYTVTKKGFSWLWLEICSDNFFINPMISRTMKNDVLQFAAQPSQIEETDGSIQRGLSQLAQQLAINS